MVPVHTYLVPTYTYIHVHAWYIWAMICQSQHEVKVITVCEAFIMNSDERREARLRRKRECRVAESSEERETRLARRGVADRARFAAISH